MVELVKTGSRFKIIETEYTDGKWVEGISIENLNALDSALYLERIGVDYLYISEAITRLHANNCSTAIFDSNKHLVRFISE